MKRATLLLLETASIPSQKTHYRPVPLVNVTKIYTKINECKILAP